MKPKKKAKEKDGLGSAPESEETDREMFLKAFEKPTQIYRYLRTRHLCMPVFLHRTLTYMKKRRSVKNTNRKSFRVDSLLNTTLEKDRTKTARYRQQYLNITFTGFFDDDLKSNKIEVETLLLKSGRKMKKCRLPSASEVTLGKVKVPVNPGAVNASGDSVSETISVAEDSISPGDQTYLVMKVRLPHNNGLLNGTVGRESQDSSHSDDQPPTKKRRNGINHRETISEFCGELLICDKYKPWQLTEGDYEIILRDADSEDEYKKSSWEMVVDGKAMAAFEIFNSCPTVRFTVTRTESTHEAADRANIMTAHHEFLNNNQYSNHISNNISSGEAVSEKESGDSTPKKKSRLFYQFLYKNNTKNQTEARDDMHCPWCHLNCIELYSLLQHLRMYHSRFKFLYSHHAKGGMIDVSLNERYDGSYVGSPQDSEISIGYAFHRDGPVRRTPITHVLVYRPKRPEPSILEFMDHEHESTITRQFVQGHNRLYYHTGTYVPITPKEINEDSEEESDPVWLRQKTVQMIDEFTDVNEGEKELMKLWNLHIMKHQFIADCQIGNACESFVEEHGKEIIRRNLYRNFILHMVNLFDFSLIRPELVQKTVAALDEMRTL